MTLIDHHHGLSVDEAPKVVSQVLGFQALGRNLRDAIETRITTLQREERIREEHGFLRNAANP